MAGLLVNMGLWKNILKHREFDAAVDHVAVTQILKAKSESTSNRIMRLLDHLSAYSFNLYYLKGKDMILADYLSRHRNEDEDTTDLIPVSFCRLRDVDTFCIGTRTSIKASGKKVPEIHGADKTLDPHKKPEHQDFGKTKTPKESTPTPAHSIHARTPDPIPEALNVRKPGLSNPTLEMPGTSGTGARAHAPYIVE